MREAANNATASLDTAKVAGLLVVAAVLVLGSLRKGFGQVLARIGD